MAQRRGPNSTPVRAAALLLLLAASGCSLKRLAVNSLASSLAESGEVFASDEDPELIRDATPFALKTIEGLLQTSPRNRDLLLAAAKGFTQYAYAFVEADAEALGDAEYARAESLRRRAQRLYLRGRDYALRGLALDHPGIADVLVRDPSEGASELTARDLDLLFWTAASWGAAMATGKDRPDLLADSAVVRALVERGLALDDTYAKGALHEVMISLEALPAAMGGSPDRARAQHRRTVELSRGLRASPHVALAASVSVATQNRAEFEELLERALAVDPDADPSGRLANVIAQRRARALLSRADELFLEEGP